MSDRYFQEKHEEAYTKLRRIEVRVPQGGVLGPVLYLLYIKDIPTTEYNTIATFADVTLILSTKIIKLQISIKLISAWSR